MLKTNTNVLMLRYWRENSKDVKQRSETSEGIVNQKLFILPHVTFSQRRPSIRAKTCINFYQIFLPVYGLLHTNFYKTKKKNK